MRARRSSGAASTTSARGRASSASCSGTRTRPTARAPANSARYMQGVGIMPEGIDNNPVAYDLVLELAWRPEHVDAAKWLEGYVAVPLRPARPGPRARPGRCCCRRPTATATAASPENVLCSRPQTARPSGDDMGQPGHRLRHGRVRPRGRPVRAGRGQVQGQRDVPPGSRRLQDAGPVERGPARLRPSWTRPSGQGTGPRSRSAAGRFLRLGRATDELLDTEASYRLGTYQAQALRYGTSRQRRRQTACATR